MQLVIAVRDLSGIEGECYASFIDEDTETKGDYMICLRWQCCQLQAFVTIAGLGACRPHPRSVY